MIAKPKTPTLDKMQAPDDAGVWTRTQEPHRVVDHSQMIGEFLDWMQAQGIVLAKWGLHDEVRVYWTERQAEREGKKWDRFGNHKDEEGYVDQYMVHHYKPVVREDQLESYHESREKLLARYFDIDLDKADDEKRALLDWIRSQPA